MGAVALSAESSGVQAATATDASSARVPLDCDHHHDDGPSAAEVVSSPASPHVPTPPPPVDPRTSQVCSPEPVDGAPCPTPSLLRCVTFDSARGTPVWSLTQ
jgi:hypothetical protein